jgi:hypothetical protein
VVNNNNHALRFNDTNMHNKLHSKNTISKSNFTMHKKA